MPVDYSAREMRHAAAYSYGENEHELELRVGDKVRNVKAVGNGWLIGSNSRTGKTGLFPKNCVKKQMKIKQTRQNHSTDTRPALTNDDVRQLQLGQSSETYASGKKGTDFNDEMIELIRKVNLGKASGDQKPDVVDVYANIVGTNRKASSMDYTLDIGKPLHINRRHKNTLSKACASGLTGVCLVGMLFLVLRYSFQYTLLASSSVTGVVCLLVGAALLLSDQSRCVVTLMGVSVFTGKGRAVFLSIATGTLLVGPVLNIAYNANQVATSLERMVEVSLDHSLAARQRQTEGAIKDIAEDVQTYVDALQNLVGSFKFGAKTAKRAVARAMNDGNKKCQDALSGVFATCQSYSQTSKTQCTSLMSQLEHSARNVIDEVAKAIDPANWFGRKRRSTLSEQYRSKRAPSSICDVFDAGNICRSLDASDWCRPMDSVRVGITTTLDTATSELSSILDQFKFTLTNLETNTNSSRQPRNIGTGDQYNTLINVDSVSMVIKSFSKCLSCLVLLMLLQAVMYHRRYRNELSFDNVYITREMKDLDKTEVVKGNVAILPLHKHERKIYIDTTSSRLSPDEERMWTSGTTMLMMHVVVAVVVVAFEYLFYHMAQFPMTSVPAETNMSSRHPLNIAVQGSGPLANLFETFIQKLDSQQEHEKDFDIRTCLPNARIPNIYSQFLIVGIYSVWLTCILLQFYGLRIQKKVLAMYNPEQETARIVFLYKHILVKRGKCCDELNEKRAVQSEVCPNYKSPSLNTAGDDDEYPWESNALLENDNGMHYNMCEQS